MITPKLVINIMCIVMLTALVIKRVKDKHILKKYNRIKQDGMTAKAVLGEEFREDGGRDGYYYYRHYTFHDVNGNHRNRMNVSLDKNNTLKKGDIVPVYYDIDHPEKSFTDWDIQWIEQGRKGDILGFVMFFAILMFSLLYY